MIKNILIGILAVSTLFLIVFANMKAKEAEVQRLMAQEQEAAAEMAAGEARKVEAEAMLRARVAEEKITELKKQLEDCQNN